MNCERIHLYKRGRLSKSNDMHPEEGLRADLITCYVVVCYYVNLALTKETDRLLAVSRLANKFSSKIRSPYLAGLRTRLT
jgi:hypothetical protein